MAKFRESVNITQKVLKEYLGYDKSTGIFTRIKPVRGYSTLSKVGTIDINGYIDIKINGERHKAHRLAWLYVYGEWPMFQLDHINQIKYDNRICNLRKSDYLSNSKNCPIHSHNKSGVMGVRKNKNGTWSSYIKVNKKQIWLGSFSKKEDAISARRSAEEKHNFDKRHNKRRKCESTNNI